MLNLCRRFLASRHGNFGLMAAISLVPLLGVAGMSIDFANALFTKERLQGAADAATLSVLNTESATMKAAYAASSGSEITAASRDAKKLFLAHISGQGGTVGTTIRSADFSVKKQDSTVRSRAEIVARVTTSFSRIIGKDYIDVKIVSEAAVPLDGYKDYYVVLDNSPSMGLAATEKGMQQLQSGTMKAVGYECSFACHTRDGSIQNTYPVARSLGIPLRFDNVLLSAQKLVETIVETRMFAEQYKVAFYHFGLMAEQKKLTPTNQLTGNSRVLSDALKTVELMSIPRSGLDDNGHSNLDKVMDEITETINNAPARPEKAEKILVLASDGLTNTLLQAKCRGKRVPSNSICHEAIDLSRCEALKQGGVKIAIIYTTYWPLDNLWYFRDHIRPIYATIPVAMEKCASPGLFAEVSTGEGITNAMSHLFIKSITSPKLTQ